MMRLTMRVFKVCSNNLTFIAVKYRNIPLEKWSEKFFENTSNQIMFTSNYFCPKVDELELNGNLFSNTSTFFSLQLKRCDYTKVPCNEEVINQYFNGLTINLVTKNQYFDYTNLDSPVQSFFSSSHYSRLSLNNEKRVKFYVRKSEYELKEGWHNLGQSKKGTFYSIDRNEIDSTLIPAYTIYWADFMLDPLMNEYERKSLTLFEAFGTIGGIFEILNIIIAFFTGIYAQHSFRHSLLKSLKKWQKEPLLSKDKDEEESIQRDRSQLYIPVANNSLLNHSLTVENPFIAQICSNSNINKNKMDMKTSGNQDPNKLVKKMSKISEEQRDEEEKEGGESI